MRAVQMPGGSCCWLELGPRCLALTLYGGPKNDRVLSPQSAYGLRSKSRAKSWAGRSMVLIGLLESPPHCFWRAQSRQLKAQLEKITHTMRSRLRTRYFTRRMLRPRRWVKGVRPHTLLESPSGFVLFACLAAELPIARRVGPIGPIVPHKCWCAASE